MDMSVGDPSSAGLEALSVLRAAAEQAGAGPLAAQLAERALRVTERADFAVAQDALQALLRRLAATRDAGVVLSGPRARGLGWYRVGQRSRSAPPYNVLLASVEPIAGSCSCPDFARASLGLCKHLFLVANGSTGPWPAFEPPPLRWDPVRPLTGGGDWLERLTWCDGSASSTELEARVRRSFRAGDGERSALPPGILSDPSARLSTVEALVRVVRARGRFAEPAIIPLLECERLELRRVRAGAMTAHEVRRHCDALKQKLLLYQREGVRRFLERGRLLLADERGLGKTAQAIAACHVLVTSRRVRRGLIVVPAPLKSQWQREWRRFTDLPLTVVDGRLDERARTAARASAAMLLVDDELLLSEGPRLRQFDPDIAVLDEPERVRSWGASGIAAHIKQLQPRWRLVLTGTSMENRLDELASIMEWVDDSALEPRWRLDSWHAAWDAQRRSIVCVRNLDTLRQRLAPSMLRRVRRDVIEQLPARRDTPLTIPLTAAQRVAHDLLRPPIGQILSRAARRPLTRPEFLRLMALLTRQRLVCNGMAHADFVEVWPSIEKRRPTPPLLEGLASPKLVELRELLSAIAVDQKRKVVVFSQWRRMLRLAGWAVSDVLRTADLRAVSLTGEESTAQRSQNVSEFHEDDRVRVLFVTDASGGGLDLKRAASCCIQLDVPWNPAVLEQRAGRIDRPGQVHPVEIYTMLTAAGLEGRIAALVGDPRAPFSSHFDGTNGAVEFERADSFLARLQSALAPAAGANDSELDDADERHERAQAGDAEDGERDHDSDVTAAEGARGAVGPASAPEAATVASLLGQVQVRQLPDGRVSLEASAHAAAALAEVFQGVAQLLSSADPVTPVVG